MGLIRYALNVLVVIMFKHYVYTAINNIAKHKLYAGINILGLAIGLASCLLIILYVSFETSYDKWLPNAERIYRIDTTMNIPGREAIATANFVGSNANNKRGC